MTFLPGTWEVGFKFVDVRVSAQSRPSAPSRTHSRLRQLLAPRPNAAGLTAFDLPHPCTPFYLHARVLLSCGAEVPVAGTLANPDTTQQTNKSRQAGRRPRA